ncbi:MAG TPA: glycosyltransferase [Terriglobia bacterium]|nr:glycosyltransferase [Terriglobia bacterium]
MRKVLFFCYDLKDGGSPQVASGILNHLNRDVFNPVLVTYSEARVFPVPEGTTEYTLHIHGGGSLFQKLKANLTAVFRLRRIIRLEEPEIAVGMGGMTNWGLILAARLARKNTSVIIGEHGAGALKYRADRVTSLMMRLLNWFLYPLADRIVAISDGVRQYLVREMKVAEGEIVLIHNPVDIKRIQKLSREQVDDPWLHDRDRPVVLWVGRMATVKGLEYLVGAFERVIKEIDARLVLVGEGSLENAIRELVRQKGLQEKVRFAGFQSNPYRYMSRSSVFAFPSLSEGFGMVLVEAMACGLPVVATDCVAGPSEVLLNGKCGILVPVADEEALARGIVSLLTDTALRERLISAAMERVTDFEPAKVIASYERLFLELCNDHRIQDPVPAAS